MKTKKNNSVDITDAEKNGANIKAEGLQAAAKNKGTAFVIGITGGIGSGKTLAAQILKAKGAYIIDTDEVSRRVMDFGSQCHQKLAAAFPDCAADGILQRPLLKKRVFSDENSRKLLNSITHPYILAAVKEELKGKKWVVVQVPLLFESGFDRFCDVTLGILADEKIRAERVLARDKMTPQLITAIMKTQLSDNELKEKCGSWIENNGSPEKLEESVNDFYQKIKKRIDGFGSCGGDGNQG